ncbi:MAG: hypothetical protein R2857_00825 [Vampirovibrionales bacterium]
MLCHAKSHRSGLWGGLADGCGGFYDGLVRLLLPLFENTGNADNTDNQLPDESQSVAPVLRNEPGPEPVPHYPGGAGCAPHLASHRYMAATLFFVPLLNQVFRATTPLLGRQSAITTPCFLDGLMVSPDSPEAFEEMIWMQFFGHLHQTSQSVVLRADDCYPAFGLFAGPVTNGLNVLGRAGIWPRTTTLFLDWPTWCGGLTRRA